MKVKQLFSVAGSVKQKEAAQWALFNHLISLVKRKMPAFSRPIGRTVL
jgi:hypothetical protein